MSSIVLTVVVDNNAGDSGLAWEHGLSLHLKSGNKAVLFDTGRSHLVTSHLDSLGLNQTPLEWIALSHGHYDHTTGTAEVLAEHPTAKLCYTPHLAAPKWILDNNTTWRYGGVPLSFHNLGNIYLQATPSSRELLPGIIASGPILETESPSFAPSRFFRNVAGYLTVDNFIDEQVLLVNTPLGLSIISGCMHTGLESTLHKAKQLFPHSPFYALVGGLHLEGASPETFDHTCDLLLHHGFSKVMPLHCTGQAFSQYLKEKAPHLLVEGHIGATIAL